jgi:uncharacterized protein with PIN domain
VPHKIPTEEELKKCLDNYIKLKSPNPDDRRQAVWALHDYYMKVLRLAALEYFNIDIDKYAGSSESVIRRWNVIYDCIKAVVSDESELIEWNSLIKMLHGFENDARHYDDDIRSPPLHRLDEINNKAVAFHNWLLEHGKKYFNYKKRNRISDSDLHLSGVARRLIGDIEYLESELGSDPDITSIIKNQYQEMVSKKNDLELIYQKGISGASLDQSESALVTNLVEIKERIDGEKWARVAKNKCPKCGGTIVSTYRYSGGAYDEPPNYVHWKVGCNKCDFEVVSDSESI